jgi:uncharacterized protein involved in exopolysaccharide biosynthesis
MMYLGDGALGRPSLQMRDIGQAIQKRPWAVLLVVLGFVGPTLGFSLLQPAVYEASARGIVGEDYEHQRWDPDIPRIMLIPLAVEIPPEAPREAIDKPAIAREAIERLGLDGSMEPAELLENLTVEREEATSFIRLSYRDGDPQRAQRIANAVLEVASEERHQVTDQVDLRIGVWEDASVPTDPLSPNPVRNAALALTLGLAVGIGLALLMDKRSRT